jgi:uncharacterized membrane protein YtjA (UPF0391 family)
MKARVTGLANWAPRNTSYGSPVAGSRKAKLMSLLKWALIFFLISIIAAVFGFTGVSAASADVARILFYIFVVIFLALLVLGLMAARSV